MARISLREYVHEIETIIDRGDTQKAIAHCKHILRFFPKHIDTYRLFGKALLELQKYGDASDIFTRVLSSVPDDFISQIGMSIIREDENNLDAAIWHLERAFEIQPSNKAVQDELKRLYSSRDGVTPTKIRLTRGALVRMYARGELYPQAIAEINAALLEDPNRVDLEVILARLYFILDQKIESTETCSRLIAKLPFCYEANRILAALLPGTSRDEDAKIFKQRVVDLDPYFDFVSENTPNPIDIPDNKVMMEFLDYVPGIETQEQTQPDWAKSIGINWETDTTGESSQIESWLNSEAELKTEHESEFLVETPIVPDVKIEKNELGEFAKTPEFVNPKEIIQSNLIPEKDEVIPNWMTEAGWTTSEIIDETAQKGFNLEIPDKSITPSDNTDEIQPGTIPDWIQKLAPKDIMDIENESDDSPIDDRRFDSLFMDETTDQENVEQLTNLSDNTWKREFSLDENMSDENVVEEKFESASVVNSNDDFKISYGNNEFSEEQQDEIVKAFENIQEDIKKQKMEEIDDSITGLAFDLEDDSLQEVIETSPLEDSTENLDLFKSELFEESFEELSFEKIPDESQTVDEKTLEEPETGMDWLHGLIHEEENPEATTSEEFQLTELPMESFLDQSKNLPQNENLLGDFSWLNALQSDFNLQDDKAEKEIEEIPDFEDKESISEITNALSPNKLTSDEVKYQPEAEDLQFEEESAPVEMDIEPEMENLVLEEEAIPDDIEVLPKIESPLFVEELLPEEMEVLPDFENLNTLENLVSDKMEVFPRDENIITEDEFLPDINEVLPEMNNMISEQESQPVTELNDSKENKIVPDFDLSSISLEEKTPDWIESLINEIPDQPDDVSISKSEYTDTMETEAHEGITEQEVESEEETEIGAALAWMEGLAAKNGAPEETLTYNSEDRNNAPPDWIKAFQEQADGVEQSEINREPSATSDMFADEDLTPSWLQALQLESLNDDVKEVFPPDFQEDIKKEDQIQFDESSQVESAQPETQITNEFITNIEATVNQNLEEELIFESIDSEKIVEEIFMTTDSETQSPDVSQDLISEKDELEDKEDHLESSFVPESKIPEIEEPVIVTEHVDTISSKEQQDESNFSEQISAGKLEDGKFALQRGNIDNAVSIFNGFIKSKESIDEIIIELQTALDHNYPINISLWQTLGDAYLRKNQLKNALDAYSKAEELLS